MITGKKHLLTLTGLLAALLFTAQADQEQLAKSIQEARAETALTADQLKATLSSLNALSKQTKGDLRPAYTTFCADVAKTEGTANMTKARLQWMAGDGAKYFADWQKNVDGIANESLRKKAQKRLASVKVSFGEVEESLKTAGEKFKPFLSNLADVQKSLAADITPGGVKAIGDVVSTANWDHKFVDRAINSALKQLKKMEDDLSSEKK